MSETNNELKKLKLDDISCSFDKKKVTKKIKKIKNLEQKNSSKKIQKLNEIHTDELNSFHKIELKIDNTLVGSKVPCQSIILGFFNSFEKINQ